MIFENITLTAKLQYLVELIEAIQEDENAKKLICDEELYQLNVMWSWSYDMALRLYNKDISRG